MRFSSRARIVGVPLAIVFGLAFFAVSMTVQVPTVRAASGPLDAQASELVRLINGARSAAGLGALVIDTNLASKARDGSIPCPDNAAKTISGRAQDFAAYSQYSHNLRLCNATGYALSAAQFVSTLQTAWGYGSVGEIIGYNGGYGNGAYLWQYSAKTLWQTWTYTTTGHMIAGWMSSPTHRSIIVGGYDRVGCGGWASAAGTYYYACEFSKGGRYATRGAPTSSPFNNPLPTPAPTPVPTAPPAGGGGGGGGGSGSGGGPAATPAPTIAPTDTPTIAPTDTPTAAPSLLVATVQIADATGTTGPLAGLQQSRDDMLPPARTSGLASAMLQLVAAAAGSVSALIAVFLAIVSMRRRRRETAL